MTTVDDKTRLAAACATYDVWPGYVYMHCTREEHAVLSITLDTSGEPMVHYVSLVDWRRWTRTMRDFTASVDVGIPRFRRLRLATSEELLKANHRGQP